MLLDWLVPRSLGLSAALHHTEQAHLQQGKVVQLSAAMANLAEGLSETASWLLVRL